MLFKNALCRSRKDFLMLTMGIDIGSTACKCVVMKDGHEVLASSVVALGTGTAGAKRVFENVLAEYALSPQDIQKIMATGYGRFTFEGTPLQKSELSCHAKGAHFLTPGAHTVIDIGGQDVKVMRLDHNGCLQNFVMNDKCAAGTGRFLEVMAKILDIGIENMAEIDATSQETISISNTCTVFAESEVISKLSNNVKIPDLVAGIHLSVAKRVASLAHRNGIYPEVTMTGGVALNHGVVRALENEIKSKIFVHPSCQLTGAIGAAIYAYEEETLQFDHLKRSEDHE